MAYDSNTKIITAPVGIADLQQCFGVVLERTVDGTRQRIVSGDLGLITKAETGNTISGWTVVSRIAINKWSKHKPIRNSKITQLSETPGNNEWINNQGNYARYGIYKPTETISPFIIDSSAASGVACPHAIWLYDKPALSDSPQYPARLTDFDKYYHYAPCPIRISWPTKTNGKIEIPISSRETDNKNNILCFTLEFENAISGYRNDGTCYSLKEILGHENFYICVAFAKKYAGTYYELRFFNTDITQTNTENFTPMQIGNVHSGNNPVVNIFVSAYEFMQKCGNSNAYGADQEWMVRVFLTGSTNNSDAQNWEMEYESGADSAICIFKSVSALENIGEIDFSIILKKSSTNVYYLQMFSATINKGTMGSSTISGYKIIGVCPTGTMKKDSTSYPELVLRDYTTPISFNSDNQVVLSNISVGSSAGTFDFSNTQTGYPKIAVVRLQVIVGSKTKEIVVTIDCSSGGDEYSDGRTG